MQGEGHSRAHCSFAYSALGFFQEGDVGIGGFRLTVRSVLLEVPFWWWFVGSFAGFLLLLAFWTLDRAAGATAWVYRKAQNATSSRAALKMEGLALLSASPTRRQFLERAAVLVSATPFV